MESSGPENPYIGATTSTSDALQAAQETVLGRRVVYWSSLFAFSALAGLALVGIEPIVVFAMFFSLLAAVAILYKPWWGLLAYTAIFLIRPGELYPILAALRLEMIVGAVALVGLAFQQYLREGRLKFDRSRQSMFLLLFIAAAALSTPMSYWRYASVQGVMTLLRILAFYVMVVQLIDTRLRAWVFIWTLICLRIYVTASSLGTFKFAQGIDRITGLTSAAGSPNEIGATVAATFPLLFLLSFHKPIPRLVRALLLASCALLLYVLAITGSRAGILGFLTALLCLWWASPRRAISAFVGGFALVVAFAVLPEQYQQRYATLTSSHLDASSRGRLDTWEDGIRMVVDHPITGVGIHAFGAAHHVRDGWALDAHNMYLEVIAEVGVIGALPFFGFLFQMLALNRRTRRLLASKSEWRFERIVLQGIFIGIVAMLVTAIFGTQYIKRLWYINAAVQLVILRLYLERASGASESKVQQELQQ